jgi:hypothetical protein
MAYIVDLTLVMQNLFRLAVVDHRPPPITRRLIKLAFKTYEESPAKAQVHNAIRDYMKEAGFFDCAGQDGVLAKIVELIDVNRVESAEMHALKGSMGDIEFTEDDEPWDVGKTVCKGE